MIQGQENGKERITIFLDGSNFYHRLKDSELGLVRKEFNSPKSEELVKNQQKLFTNLKKQDWTIKTGFMMKHDKDYKEKGVDVKLAVDILDMAYQDKYDTAIMVSSDTDLIPGIIRAKELGKKIEYIGFSHRPSFAMQRYANLSRLLSKIELEQFFLKTLF